MVTIEAKTITIVPEVFSRHGWQLSDESDEDDGVVTAPGGDDTGDEDDLEDDFEVGDEEPEEEQQ